MSRVVQADELDFWGFGLGEGRGGEIRVGWVRLVELGGIGLGEIAFESGGGTMANAIE